MISLAAWRRSLRIGAVFVGALYVSALPAENVEPQVRIGCEAMAGVLGSVELEDCLAAGLAPTGATTVQGRPILVREYPPLSPRRPQARVLLVGGIHGDEYSSFSVIFRWLRTLNRHHSGLFHWRIVPGLNVDGLNAGPAERTNANGVDLNRNFPTPDWHSNKQQYWVDFTGKDPRKYPGDKPLSEPETRFLFREIKRFQPDAIVAVHAPFGVLDFDGPKSPPENLGYLWLNRLGTYPGSLGNYAGLQKDIPVVTMELPHAGIMPTHDQSEQVWVDLVAWLKERVHVNGGLRRPPQDLPPARPPLLTASYSSSASCTICQSPEADSLRQNCCLRTVALKRWLE